MLVSQHSNVAVWVRLLHHGGEELFPLLHTQLLLLCLSRRLFVQFNVL